MSGSGYIGKTTNQEAEVQQTRAQAERESMWGPIDGEIVSYDATKQTAEIKPLYRPLVLGEARDMPNLLEVPLRFPSAGAGGAITHPVPVGTKVRLTPGMRNSENYHTERDGSPFDTRSFSVNDMEATLTGGESLADPIPNVDPDNTHVRFNADGTFGIRGSADGKIKIEGAEGDIYALTSDLADHAASVAEKLGTEPTLIHVAEYAALGVLMRDIATKLAAMKL